MKRCLPRVKTKVPGRGSGPGVSLYVTQDTRDPGGWTIALFANFGADAKLMKRFVLSPRPAVAGDRLLFVGGAPGASSWSAVVESPLAIAANAPPLLVDVVSSAELVTPFDTGLA